MVARTKQIANSDAVFHIDQDSFVQHRIGGANRERTTARSGRIHGHCIETFVAGGNDGRDTNFKHAFGQLVLEFLACKKSRTTQAHVDDL